MDKDDRSAGGFPNVGLIWVALVAAGAVFIGTGQLKSSRPTLTEPEPELRAAARNRLAEILPHHPFPGVELEQHLDRRVFKVDELAGLGQPDFIDIKEARRDSRLLGALLKVADRGAVLVAVAQTGKMQRIFASVMQVQEGGNQFLVQRVELVRTSRQLAVRGEFLQPEPLENAGFEQGCRRIRVVFEQLCRPLPVIGEIEAAIEVAVAALPAFPDLRPERLGNGEFGQDFLVTAGISDKFEGHFLQFGGWSLDVFLYFPERESKGRCFIPIGAIFRAVKGKPDLFGFFAPVGTFGNGDPAHGL